MTDAQVTEEQLAKSNEPEFTGALKEKKAGEEHAATAPGEVRTAEAQTLAGAKADASATGTQAVAGMRGDKLAATTAVGKGQQGAQGKDESKRAQVTAKLQTVFDATQKDVEAILTGLDTKVDDSFTTGEKTARDAFTAEHKRRMDEYKDKRYSGLIGKGRWIKDKFAGLPEEANQIFVTARQGYVTTMQSVISTVADVIGGELNRAKQRIATGRQQLQAEVQKLPADLQAVGKEAAGEFAGKFDELTENVDAKGKELVNTLASKYNEALKSVDAEIDAEKEKNKGLIAKAVDAVKGVIDTILKLKDLLLGVLAKAAAAVMAILKDPIGFLGNLVSAVGAGLKAFMSNIGAHLKKGLIGWLLGTMSGAGIQLPDKFDLRGILSMIASMLGLTWAAIRGRIIAKGVPEQAMGAVEAGVPVVAKLQSQGVAGAYEEIKDQVGDLKENLLGKISEYLVPTVLIAGITWIISLLNPASAFIKACKMIIDIVTFIIERGAQIIEFVNAVLDAVIAIAGGGAGGVPGLIEAALAKSIPVLIGALAAILGIGGIATKVKSFFQALSKPVMKAVDWVVGKIVGLGKKIWAKLKGATREKDKSKDSKPGTTGKDGTAGKEGTGGKDGTAIKEAEAVLATRPKSDVADARISALAKRHSVPLRVVVESQTPTSERVHVQTMATGSHDLPKDEGAETEEVKLLDNGQATAEERQKVLDGVRAVVQNEKIIGTILQMMRDKQIKPANRIGILQKLTKFGQKGGFRLISKEKKDIRGPMQLNIDYEGVFRDNQSIRIGLCKPGGSRPVGLAWVEPKSIDPGDTPAAALTLDFLVDPRIEHAGVLGVGSEMFKIASDHYKTQYEAVSGDWYTFDFYKSKATNRPAMSTNLVRYLAARKAGMSPELAVTRTWTYGRVKEMYGNVPIEVKVHEIDNLDFDNPPKDEKIVSCLMRPA
ncbi:hypothetical protein [Actinoplanes sp. NBRC 103695]|uniref:phage tail protein n=2 Tax=Actinoplanes sp. NBRC 103695 TaxID=3032202 RepID=UPI0024A26EB1|nr:hypothetical protein [Actinoplanes sp. NBRC 103695]GLZ00745.1 hypothetical protein Acsp02_79970 [Actinoplanes sp. NBRC 103695]